MWVPILAGLAAFAVGAGTGAWVAGPAVGGGSLSPLDVSARPLPLDRQQPARDRVGRLRFLGALQLNARDIRFGGISALLFDARCARLLAATDSGSWLILEPKEEGDRLTGLGAAWIAPVLDAGGRPPPGKYEADAEALMWDGDSVLLWFEQDHRAQRYPGLSPCEPDSLAQPAAEVIRLPRMAGWPENGGVEAAATLEGRWILIAEQGGSGNRQVTGLVKGPGGVTSFRYPAADEFLPTAADAIDPDTLVVVKRRFSRLRGVAARIELARLPGKEGETADTALLAELAPPLLVDNMEAVAVRTEGHRTFLYVASDDNFNPVQKTLLMKFEILEGATPAG